MNNPPPPPPSGSKSNTAIMFEQRTEQTLTESAKIFRDAFVRSYVLDYRGDLALFRLGFEGDAKSARQRASRLLTEQYVSSRLAELVRQLQPSDVVTRGQVMSALWKEANNAFEDGVRVQALAHLGKMLGMMDSASNTPNSMPMGVMVIPMIDASAWSANAQNSQLLLKQRAGDESEGGS